MFQRWKRYEASIFLGVLLLHLAPLLSGQFVPTLDGPSHLYNARLINDLLFGSNGTSADFFALNQEPVPNWTGHFILASTKLFLPAYLAEKLLLLFYAVGLAYALRYLLQSIKGANPLFAYLFLPFIYHELFFVGFYNFSLGLLFLFWSLGYYQRIKGEGKMGKRLWGFFILALLTYFSHLFAFATLLLVIGIERAIAIGVHFNHSNRKKQEALNIRWHGELILCLLPPGLLMLSYFLERPITGEAEYLPLEELRNRLFRLDPLIGKNEEREAFWSQGVGLGMLVLFLIGVYRRINESFSDREKTDDKGNVFFKRSDLWGLIALVLLGFYFFFPDSNGSASVISSRFCLLFFLFLSLWIATLPLPRWTLFLFFTFILLTTFRLDAIYIQELAPLQEAARNGYQLRKELGAESVVLPVNRSGNWDHHHFSNYLGVEGSAIVLENYEANKGYFPVIWDEDVLQTRLAGQGTMDLSCLDWNDGSGSQVRSIDHVLVLGEKNADGPCQNRIDSILDRFYRKVAKTSLFQLYRLKGEQE